MMILSLLLACAPVEPSDDASLEPALWLLLNLDRSEDEVAPRIEKLAEYANSVVGDAPLLDRVFQPGIPTQDQLTDIPHSPEGAELKGFALVRQSDHELGDLIRLATATDRTCMEGGLSTTWTRTVTAGADCFVTGACDEALANDDIAWTFDEPAFTFNFELEHELRTFELIDGRVGYAARSWQPRAAVPPRFSDALDQSFGVDVMVPDLTDEERTWRIQVRWVALEMGSPSPLDARPLGDRISSDIDEAFLRQDAALEPSSTCGFENP